jgi:serine protease inhibitor
MPFWEKFKRREVPQVKETRTYASDCVSNGVAVSLQSFGLALLRQESSLKQKQNIFISPLSIFLALAMAENGAVGETKAAMRKALAIAPEASEEEINESAAMIMKSLESQGEAELDIANALWVHVSSSIAPDFVRRCEEIYSASAQTLNLNQPSSAVAINKWISERTRNNILNIVSPDNIAGAIAVLTNAVYFKGKFRFPFLKELTGPERFYLVDGREKVVPMMRNEWLPDSYRSGKGFEAAVLRYKDSQIALYMLLPARGTNPEQILTEKSVQEMLVAKGSITLDLSMPRFTVNLSSHLKEALAQLGMGIAFKYPGADFTALGSPSFFLDEVIHKTRLEVDEEGTVAAAATGIVMETCSLIPEDLETKTLIFDRPFALLLRDTITGAVVFAGVIYEP